MSESDRFASMDLRTTRNATVSWALVAVLLGTLLGGVVQADLDAILFSASAIAVIAAPAVIYRDPTVVPPWYFVLLICLPVLWETLVPVPHGARIVPSVALATLGLLLAVDLQRFTTLRLVPWFAVALTVLFTLAMGALLNVLRWWADVVLGTSYLLDGRSQDAINDALMVEFMYVTIAGVLAGGLFLWYFSRHPRRPDRPAGRPAAPTARAPRDIAGPLLSDRLGVPVSRQRQAARAMQVCLGLLMAYGLWTREIGVVVNAGVALGITFLPALLERDYHIAIEPGLVLWVTTAVFLHALGTWGAYGLIPPWDHLTHAFSMTVVAAAGYATLRAIHLHARSIHLPPWALFAFTMVFVLAMGVLWELLEFFVDELALLVGMDPVLAQHGIDDTILDVVFNSMGALVVATWGTIYLTEVSESLATELEGRLGS